MLAGRDPHTNDERNGSELEVMDMATNGKRVAFAGRLVGTSLVHSATMFRETPAQVTAKDFQEVIVVVADSP
jgi:hypothetical protein